jgi:hypothetical protein
MHALIVLVPEGYGPAAHVADHAPASDVQAVVCEVPAAAVGWLVLLLLLLLRAAVLDVMVAAIQALGVTVLQYHAESAPGQFEIATGPGVLPGRLLAARKGGR